MGSEVGTIFLGLDFGASSNSETVTGWWFGTFFHILEIILPIDQLIFFRGLTPPTRIDIQLRRIVDGVNCRAKHRPSEAKAAKSCGQIWLQRWEKTSGHFEWQSE